MVRGGYAQTIPKMEIARYLTLSYAYQETKRDLDSATKKLQEDMFTLVMLQQLSDSMKCLDFIIQAKDLWNISKIRRVTL